MAELKKDSKRKILCPECETEVEIIRDEDGDDQGVCGNCGLNVGKILTRRRYDRAYKKVSDAEVAAEEAAKKKAKKKDMGW